MIKLTPIQQAIIAWNNSRAALADARNQEKQTRAALLSMLHPVDIPIGTHRHEVFKKAEIVVTREKETTLSIYASELARLSRSTHEDLLIKMILSHTAMRALSDESRAALQPFLTTKPKAPSIELRLKKGVPDDTE